MARFGRDPSGRDPRHPSMPDNGTVDVVIDLTGEAGATDDAETGPGCRDCGGSIAVDEIDLANNVQNERCRSCGLTWQTDILR